MTPVELCTELLRLGRTADFAAIGALPGAGNHAAVVRLADVNRRSMHAYFTALSANEHAPFLKALAIYEDTVNGIGSVTLLHDFLPIVIDPQHELLDWILRNTRSYWYYALNTRSYEALLLERRWRAEITAANIQRDEERQAKDRIRVAQQSTVKLYNAVRRGDTKAVQALLRRGADPEIRTPDSESLRAFATKSQCTEIATLLRSPAPPAENSP